MLGKYAVTEPVPSFFFFLVFLSLGSHYAFLAGFELRILLLKTMSD